MAERHCTVSEIPTRQAAIISANVQILRQLKTEPPDLGAPVDRWGRSAPRQGAADELRLPGIMNIITNMEESSASNWQHAAVTSAPCCPPLAMSLGAA
jgi:hypothetical protein